MIDETLVAALAPGGPLSGRRVALLGDVNVDVVLDIPELPRAGGDALGSSQGVGLGGSAANTAVLLKRLGAAATMLSCVGNDPWSRLALDALEAEGVDVSHIRRHAVEPTSLNVVAVTPDGERTMLAYRGASPRYAPEHLPRDVVTGSDLLHVSGYALLRQPQSDAAMVAIELAHGAGVSVSLDLPVGPAEQSPEQVRMALPVTDLLVVGVPEAQLLVGEGGPEALCAELLARGVGTVALKLGAQGALVVDAHGMVSVPGVPRTVVDTTGAGDAFCAGALVGRLAGLGTDGVARLANLCGAAAIGKRGAGRNMPTLTDVTGTVYPVSTSVVARGR